MVRNLFVSILLGCFSIGSVAAKSTVWDMPTPYPPGNLHTENIQRFVEDVAAATDGALRIQVHPGGSLFKANEIKRAVQTGQAQIGEVIISSLANENPLFALDTVPFVATSYADAKRLWQVSRVAIEEAFAKQGMKILYAVPWPPQGLYTKKPVSSLADLKGWKIRAYSPTVAKMIEHMGAQPVTIQEADLPQALATGMLDANFTSSATGYDRKSWEYLSYFYDVKAWLPKNVVFVSQRAFMELDPNAQRAVLEAAKAAEERGWKISEEKTAWYVEQLKANGMKVVEPSETLRKELDEIGIRMAQEWLEQAGEAGKKILDAYRSR